MEGRYVTKATVFYAEEKFLDEHHNELLGSSGFCAFSDKAYDFNGKTLRGVYFTDRMSATMFAGMYSAYCYTIPNKEEEVLGHKIAVFSDWYRNKEWRTWYRTPIDQTLDVVTMTPNDFEKTNDAFNDAMDRKILDLGSLTKELPLRRFLLHIIGVTSFEFDYDKEKGLKVTLRRENKFQTKITSFTVIGAKPNEEDPTTLDYEIEWGESNPWYGGKEMDEATYYSTWTFIIVNWFIKNLPSHYRKTKRTLRPKNMPKKKKGGQRPLSVIIRDEYVIDLTDMDRKSLRHEIKCLCWGVRGHVRHYKSGKTIFINPYRKGKERKNPNAYTPKTYEKKEAENNDD